MANIAWQPFTPTYDNFPTDVSHSGSEGFYRRVGDSIEVRTYSKISGVPKAENGEDSTFKVYLPANFEIDFNKIPGKDVGSFLVGTVRAVFSPDTFVGAATVGGKNFIQCSGPTSGLWNAETPRKWFGGSVKPILQTDFSVPVI